MIHIKKTKRWGELQDKIDEQEYKRMIGLTSTHITPKELKLQKVMGIYGYSEKELKHLTSKQLGAMLKKYEKTN